MHVHAAYVAASLGWHVVTATLAEKAISFSCIQAINYHRHFNNLLGEKNLTWLLCQKLIYCPLRSRLQLECAFCKEVIGLHPSAVYTLLCECPSCTRFSRPLSSLHLQMRFAHKGSKSLQSSYYATYSWGFVKYWSINRAYKIQLLYNILVILMQNLHRIFQTHSCTLNDTVQAFGLH